ncbi:MAG: hypothetical protein ABI797_05895 [Chloroflexota bacterium]
MNVVFARLDLPNLDRWRPLVVVAAVLAALVLLALGAAILVAAGGDAQDDLLLAPFRWGPEPVTGAPSQRAG